MKYNVKPNSVDELNMFLGFLINEYGFIISPSNLQQMLWAASTQGIVVDFDRKKVNFKTWRTTEKSKPIKFFLTLWFEDWLTQHTKSRRLQK